MWLSLGDLQLLLEQQKIEIARLNALVDKLAKSPVLEAGASRFESERGYQPNDEYPDCVMSISDFDEAVCTGVFTDDDGGGEYLKKTGIFVSPSTLKLGNKEFHGVIWYNK